MESFQLAVMLTESQLIKTALKSNNLGKLPTERELRLMLDTLYDHTKAMFGSQRETAIEFMKEVTTMAKTVFKSDDMWSDDIKSSLKSLNTSFSSNYSTTNRLEFNHILLLPHVNCNIQGKLKDIFYPEGNNKTLKSFAIILAIFGIWYFFLVLLNYYAVIDHIETPQTIIKNTLQTLNMANAMRKMYEPFSKFRPVVQTAVVLGVGGVSLINWDLTLIRTIFGLYSFYGLFADIFLPKQTVPSLPASTPPAQPSTEIIPRGRSPTRPGSGRSGRRSPTRRLQRVECENCEDAAKFRCPTCKTAYYCGKQCQQEHWIEHSSECASQDNT